MRNLVNRKITEAHNFFALFFFKIFTYTNEKAKNYSAEIKSVEKNTKNNDIKTDRGKFIKDTGET